MRTSHRSAIAAAALLTIAGLSGHTALAQSAPADAAATTPAPASAEAIALADPASVLVAPIVLDRSLRLTLPVTIGGQGPFGFIVDTGAERTVMAREVAEQLGLPVVGQARVVGLAEAVTSDLVSPGHLGLEHLTLETGMVPTFSLSNIGAPGLIGIDSLQRHKVVIDFVAGHIDIRPSAETRSRVREPEFDRDSITVIARRRAGRLILSDARINGERIDIVIDTGGQVTVGNIALQRLVQRQRGQSVALSPGELRTVTGASLSVERGQIARISVGGVDFNDLPVAYARSPAFTELGLDRRPALMLGMDALRLFDRIAVDFANRRVTFDLPSGARREGPERLALNAVR